MVAAEPPGAVSRRLLKAARLLLPVLAAVSPLSLGWAAFDIAAPGSGPGPSRILPVILNLSDIVALTMAGLWLAAQALDPARPLRTGPAPVAAAMAALPLLCLASAPWSDAPQLALVLALRLMLAFGVYLVAASEAGRSILAVFAVLTALQGAAALGQFWAQRPLGLAWLGEPPFSLDVWGATMIEVDGERWLRAYGFTPHPNILANWLLVGLALTAALFRPGQRVLMQAALVMGIALGVAGLLVAFSRAAWLGFAVGAVYLAAGALRARRRAGGSAAPLAWAAAAAVGVLLLAAPFGGGLAAVRLGALLHIGDVWRNGVSADLPPLEAMSLAERLSSQQVAARIIAERPLTGVGGGNFKAGVFNPALLAAVELGAAGGAVWLLLTIVPAARVLARLRRPPDDLAGLLPGAAVLALAVSSQFNPDVWSSQQGRMLLWLTLGVWAQSEGMRGLRGERGGQR